MVPSDVKPVLDVPWWSLTNHILDVSCRSPAYPEMYRDTMFAISVCPELYWDAIFTIIVHSNMLKMVQWIWLVWMRWLECGRMSQDECSTEARKCTKRKPKERTTRSGATAPTKAPVRQQGATHKRSKTTSPFCVVLKTYHLDTWILHKTWLKHSNFLNRKTVCPIVSTWNIMATTMGQRTEEKQNKLRQSFKNTAITT